MFSRRASFSFALPHRASSIPPNPTVCYFFAGNMDRVIEGYNRAAAAAAAATATASGRVDSCDAEVRGEDVGSG